MLETRLRETTSTPTTAYLDSLYLRLDCANDPLTGALEVRNVSDTEFSQFGPTPTLIAPANGTDSLVSIHRVTSTGVKRAFLGTTEVLTGNSATTKAAGGNLFAHFLGDTSLTRDTTFGGLSGGRNAVRFEPDGAGLTTTLATGISTDCIFQAGSDSHTVTTYVGHLAEFPSMISGATITNLYGFKSVGNTVLAGGASIVDEVGFYAETPAAGSTVALAFAAQGSGKIGFRYTPGSDPSEFINSAAADHLDLNAATSIDMNADVVIGADGAGFDFTAYGDTAGKYLKWDESNDGARLEGGLSRGNDPSSLYWMYYEETGDVMSVLRATMTNTKERTSVSQAPGGPLDFIYYEQGDGDFLVLTLKSFGVQVTNQWFTNVDKNGDSPAFYAKDVGAVQAQEMSRAKTYTFYGFKNDWQDAGSGNITDGTFNMYGVHTGPKPSNYDTTGGTLNFYGIYSHAGHNVFNEDGGDWDFRVEGSGEANLLFIDASTDRVGVGTATPATELDVVGDLTVSGRTYIYDYESITITNDSDASAAEFDIFDTNNYTPAITTDEHETRGITYDNSDGTFTVSRAGVYVINCNFILTVSASANVQITIKKNGSELYDRIVLVHSSVDPAEYSIMIMDTLAASDEIEFFVDSQTAATVTVQDGTTATIFKLS